MVSGQEKFSEDDMHEVTLRREMLSQVQAYKQRARPEGPEVRPMTSQEIDQYSSYVADAYENLAALDNQTGDTDPTKGRISIDRRSVDDGITDSFPVETTDSIEATFGGRSRALEVTQDTSNRPLYDTSDPGHSSTDMLFAEQNVGFITGIVLNRNDNTVSGTQFFIDRLAPENSTIAHARPATARGI